jgi:hypothetical protein
MKRKMKRTQTLDEQLAMLRKLDNAWPKPNTDCKEQHHAKGVIHVPRWFVPAQLWLARMISKCPMLIPIFYQRVADNGEWKETSKKGVFRRVSKLKDWLATSDGIVDVTNLD